MDNLPNGGKVVIVDDCFQEILPLINILNKNAIPVIYYSGRANELPIKPLQGIRFIFSGSALFNKYGYKDNSF